MELLDRCPLETWLSMEKADAVSRFNQRRAENIVEP